MQPTTQSRRSSPLPFFLVGGFVALVFALIGAMWLVERRRLRILLEELTKAGLKASTRPDPSEKHAAFESVGPFQELRTGAAGVVWSASGEVQGRQVVLLEHRYSTGSGKNRRTYHHTIASVPAPAAWPAVRLVDENIFHKIAELFGSKDVKLDDEAFNKRWRVTADDAEFAVLVLSPEVQSWSLLLPRGTQVRVGRGAVCVAAARRGDAEAALGLAHRARELASLIPPELEAWGLK